jgi:hypothetical protein
VPWREPRRVQPGNTRCARPFPRCLRFGCGRLEAALVGMPCDRAVLRLCRRLLLARLRRDGSGSIAALRRGPRLRGPGCRVQNQNRLLQQPLFGRPLRHGGPSASPGSHGRAHAPTRTAGASMHARGRELRHRPGLLWARMHREALQPARSVPRRRRGVRLRLRLLLRPLSTRWSTRCGQGGPLRGACELQGQRRHAVHSSDRRGVQRPRGLLLEAVRRDERRGQALPARRRLLDGVRSVLAERRLLFRPVLARTRPGRALPGGRCVRRGRRDLPGRRRLLQRTPQLHAGRRGPQALPDASCRLRPCGRNLRARSRVLRRRALRSSRGSLRLRGILFRRRDPMHVGCRLLQRDLRVRPPRIQPRLRPAALIALKGPRRRPAG